MLPHPRISPTLKTGLSTDDHLKGNQSTLIFLTYPFDFQRGLIQVMLVAFQGCYGICQILSVDGHVIRFQLKYEPNREMLHCQRIQNNKTVILAPTDLIKEQDR
jgi:hypothetical protein